MKRAILLALLMSLLLVSSIVSAKTIIRIVPANVTSNGNFENGTVTIRPASKNPNNDVSCNDINIIFQK